MPNFEFKKDCVSATALNLALDSIVIVVVVDDDRTQGFRPMVSSALWGKAPAARLYTKNIVIIWISPDFPPIFVVPKNVLVVQLVIALRDKTLCRITLKTS